jgi:hypothetical protein
MVLDRPEKVADVVLKEMRKWFNVTEEMLHKRGKPFVSQVVFPNGSTINFMFHEQSELAFESLSDISAIIMDEMPMRSIFIALTRGQRDKHIKPKILLASTMIASSWIYKDLYMPWSRGEREDVDFFSGTMYDNELNLAEGYIDRFSRNLTEKEKEVRIYGRFSDIDGLAIAHLFRRDVHLIPRRQWSPSYPVVIAIDPAMRKPHVACMIGITPDDQLIYLKELRLKGAAREFAQRLKEFYAGHRVVDIVCDSMGSSDLTGGDGTLSFIRVLQDEGIRVRATTYSEKDDEAWTQMIQDVLLVPDEPDNFGKHTPKLTIVEDCKGIISDIETAAWVRERNTEEFKPKIDISQKDYLACLKYALASQPRFSKGKERVIGGAAGWNTREKWRSKLGIKRLR